MRLNNKMLIDASYARQRQNDLRRRNTYIATTQHLVDQAYARRVPHRHHQSPATITPEQRAEELVRDQEQGLEQSMARNLADSQSNAARIGRLIPYLESVRGDIPLSFLLGWIDKESSGKVNSEEQLHHGPEYHLDEVGLFQLSIDERNALHLAASDRQRILSDHAFAIDQGIRLIQSYERFLSSYGVDADSPAAWELIKFVHKAGEHHVGRVLDAAQAGGLDPAEMSWRDLKLFVASHPNALPTLHEMNSVDVVKMRGNYLKNLLTAPQ